MPAGAAAARPDVLERVASFASVASMPSARSASGEGVPFEVLLFVALAGDVAALFAAPETLEDVVELHDAAAVEDEEDEDELLLLEVVCDVSLLVSRPI